MKTLFFAFSIIALTALSLSLVDYWINRQIPEKLSITSVVFTGTNQVRGAFPPTLFNQIMVLVRNNGSKAVTIDKAWVNGKEILVSTTGLHNPLQTIGLTYAWTSVTVPPNTVQLIGLTYTWTSASIYQIQLESEEGNFFTRIVTSP